MSFISPLEGHVLVIEDSLVIVLAYFADMELPSQLSIHSCKSHVLLHRLPGKQVRA
jgi:hypothetical protein